MCKHTHAHTQMHTANIPISISLSKRMPPAQVQNFGNLLTKRMACLTHLENLSIFVWLQLPCGHKIIVPGPYIVGQRTVKKSDSAHTDLPEKASVQSSVARSTSLIEIRLRAVERVLCTYVPVQG